MKTSRRGAVTKRSGAKRGDVRTRSSMLRAQRSAGGRRARTVSGNATETAVALWKSVGAKMKMRDLSLHLQGLYAELGKAVYELQGKKQSAVSKRSRELAELFGKIAEMRRNKSKIEEAGRAHSKTV